MGAVQWIAVWGLVALAAAIAGGIVAGYKNRDPSSWAAWCLLFPPLVLLLLLMGRNRGLRRRPPTLDEEDRHHGTI